MGDSNGAIIQRVCGRWLLLQPIGDNVMTRVLICEDDAVLRQKFIEYFARAGYSVQALDAAFRALAQAFAPAAQRLNASDFRGLEADMAIMDDCWEGEGNHPDGWYRKFYSEKHGCAARHAKRPTWNRSYRTARPRHL